jgi:hypothetical protein
VVGEAIFEEYEVKLLRLEGLISKAKRELGLLGAKERSVLR